MAAEKGSWLGWLAALCTAFRFLTVLPISWRGEGDQARFPRSVAFFPVVGVGIGVLAAGLAVVLQSLLPQMVAAFLLVFFLGAISNFLHFDGLADSGDGLFSARSQTRSLEIMKDSRVGAMGVSVVLFVVLGKFAALSSLAPARLPLALFCMPLAGRMALLVTMATVKYGRPEGGLGALFYSSASRKYALVWGGVCAAAAPFLLGFFGVLLCVAVAVVLLLFNRKCNRQLGGATGDTLGAQCELAELVTAVCFSALPFS